MGPTQRNEGWAQNKLQLRKKKKKVLFEEDGFRKFTKLRAE